MKNVRFRDIVDSAGRPEVYLLWSSPSKDKTLQKADRAHRVMMIHQTLVGHRADYGTIGFDADVTGQILIFPRSLKKYADRKVIGISYDLVKEGAPPRRKKERLSPAPKSAKVEAPPLKASPSPEKSALQESMPRTRKGAKPTRAQSAAKPEKPPRPKKPKQGSDTPSKIIPFPRESEEKEGREVRAIKSEVRRAVRALEAGKQVVAFNLLKKILAK